MQKMVGTQKAGRQGWGEITEKRHYSPFKKASEEFVYSSFIQHLLSGAVIPNSQPIRSWSTPLLFAGKCNSFLSLYSKNHAYVKIKLK